MTILIKREVLEIELEWQRRYIQQLERVLEAAEWVLTHPEREGRLQFLKEAVRAARGNEKI